MTKQANDEVDNLIAVGKYIIINRKKFVKLLYLTNDSSVYLGKDKIHLNGIIGHSFWSTFKMVPVNSKREFTLAVCKPEDIVESDDLLKGKIKSGSDNRNIWDDGSSQLLSTEEIIEMRDSGLSSQTIVGCLIRNSKTFHNKTEYSQEKYLKKKGTKYFEYLTIKKPTIRLLSEYFFAKDSAKILGLRSDSLSQIITAVNLQPDGTYILYENGSQGLVAATILNYLSEFGKLIYVTPGKHPQQHAILAMNFNQKLNRLKCITLAKLSEELKNFEIIGDKSINEKGSQETTCKLIEENKGNCDNVKELIDNETDVSVLALDNVSSHEKEETINGVVKVTSNDSHHDLSNIKKRKTEECNYEASTCAKKPRWEIEAEEALSLLKLKTSDGLIIVCKEFPSNLLTKLLRFLEYSRQFVVFNLCREPLAHMYAELKARHDVINLRLTETWLRSYQVLPDRTHPDVLMSGNSGHLLTGTVVNNL